MDDIFKAAAESGKTKRYIRGDAIHLQVPQHTYENIMENIATCWGCRCEEGGYEFGMKLFYFWLQPKNDSASSQRL